MNVWEFYDYANIFLRLFLPIVSEELFSELDSESQLRNQKWYKMRDEKRLNSDFQ